jgi:hypothetical protein
MIQRATIFVTAPDEADPEDYKWVISWLERWQGQVIVAEYSTGGWENLWNVSGPQCAIQEVSEHLLCSSEWVSGSAFLAQ